MATPTPTWLTQGEMALCPCGWSGRRRKGSFIEKTIEGASNVMRQAMFSEDVAAQDDCCSGWTRGRRRCRCWDC